MPRKEHRVADSSRTILMISTAVLNHWTVCCNGLYNYKCHPDTSLLQSNQNPTQEDERLPVLREKVKEAACSLKAGEFLAVDSISSELLKNGGEATITFLTCDT